ncbi:polysaccharide deacetylase family protein [Arthrobacter sp. UYEF3]|uniref:polysaccharide deacetylase family protein n=1 Tax=Arthrobacter sp. UYEF3 TaxID=1756365 RepID=UPI003397BFDF
MAWTPDRRSFLMAAAVTALAGCSPDQQETAPSLDAAAVTAPASALPAGHAAQPQAAPPQALPTRDQVTATYGGRKAKYWGVEAPGVLTRLPAGASGVALTIDFCGGPSGNSADLALLTLLRQQHLAATLFMNSRWIAANLALAKELASEPLFELANHGTAHIPLSVSGNGAYGIPGTRNPGEVFDEIMTNDARLIELTGQRAHFFRPGTAHLDEVSAGIVRALGLIPVGFSINGDGGATFPAATVTQEISRARAGDIVIVHGNHPSGGTTPGLVRALAALRDRGEKLVPLPRS